MMLGLTFFWHHAEHACGHELVARKPKTRHAIEDSLQHLNRGKKSPKGAMLRSLAFPGWGQWFNEQKIKSVLVFTTQGALIGLRFHFNNKAKKSDPGSQERAINIDKRNSIYWIMGAVTLLSMLDAYIDAHLFDFDTGPDLEMRVGVLSTSTSMDMPMMLGLSLRTRF